MSLVEGRFGDWRLCKAREYAQTLGVPEQWLRDTAKKEHGPVQMEKGHIRFHLRDLEAWREIARFAGLHPKMPDHEGYVYFIRAENGLVKIGWSSDPKARLRDLQVGSPSKLELIGAISCTRELEGKLHERYAELRHHGEWFEPAPRILALAKKHQGGLAQGEYRASALGAEGALRSA